MPDVPDDAREHGYRPVTAGKRKCLSCRFGGPEKADEHVYCDMFEFWARARGVCDEWAREEAS